MSHFPPETANEQYDEMNTTTASPKEPNYVVLGDQIVPDHTDEVMTVASNGEIVQNIDFTLPEKPAKEPTLAELFPVETELEIIPKNKFQNNSYPAMNPIHEPERSQFIRRRSAIVYRGVECWLDRFCATEFHRRCSEKTERAERIGKKSKLQAPQPT